MSSRKIFNSESSLKEQVYEKYSTFFINTYLYLAKIEKFDIMLVSQNLIDTFLSEIRYMINS